MYVTFKQKEIRDLLLDEEFDDVEEENVNEK